MKISYDKVTKTYGSQKVLRDITFAAEFSHAMVVIGPSGGGKSTVLRLLAGLEPTSSGDIMVAGQKVPRDSAALRAYRQSIGIVFQSFNLFPHLTAYENVVLPLEKIHHHTDARDRAYTALRRFQMESHADKRPGQLSGGQSQRVAIARALAIEPRFFIMDEPTSALDPEMTAEVLQIIADLREIGKPLIMATHEMGIARTIADTVVFVAEGQVQECTPGEQFFREPTTPLAAKFMTKILKF